MSKKPILQHFVPRFYLRYFSIPETKDLEYPQVWVVSKNNCDKEPFITGIHNIAAQRYLYSPIDLEGNRNWIIEDKLSKIEGLLGRVWDSLANGFVCLDHIVVRRPIAWFVATQFLRNPRMINEGKLAHTNFVEYLESLPPKELDPVLLKEYETYKNPSEDFFQRFFVDFLNSNSQEVMECLLEKRWSIICSKDPVFVTSDNPVVMFNPRNEKFGIKTKGTTILFPISPYRVLILDDLQEKPNFKYYYLDSYGPGKINYLIWVNVLKFMFSHRNSYEVLKEIIDFVDSIKGDAIPGY